MPEAIATLRVGRWARLCLCLLLIGPCVQGTAQPIDQPTGPPYQGRLLAEVLRDLQASGVNLFFTSNMVRPEMRVASEPAASADRAHLADLFDQLLSPHELKAVLGPGNRWVVVDSPPPPGVRGTIRHRQSGEPIAGVRLFLTPAGGSTPARETRSGRDGSFELADPSAGVQMLEARLPGYVVERQQIEVPPNRAYELDIDLEAAPVSLDEIVVTPSRVSLMRDEPVAGIGLDRDDIFALPHLGDDIFRAFTLLPGITGEEVSARFSVRGGRADEVLVLLDQVELYEPYHMKDYSSSLSIITPLLLQEVNLITGGFPAQYGDRMSGVLDMTTVQPSRRRTHLGLGLLTAEIGSSGTFANQRGLWTTSARRGQLDLALEFLGQNEKPRFWDATSKVEYQLTPSQRLGFHLLHSDDELDYFNIDPDTIEDYRTSYGNSYAWLRHQAIFGSRLFIDSAASIGRVDRDRRANEIETDVEEADGGMFDLTDLRTLDVASVKQDWNFQPSDRHYVKWGFEARRLESDYDYFNQRQLDDPLADIRSQPRTGTVRFDQHLTGDQVSAYVSDRVRLLDPLTVELGLRWDRQTLTQDDNYSPRVNLVYAPGQDWTLRLAWGYFHQSQRPYELQVADGITALTQAERTEHRIIGFERRMARSKSDFLFRIEAYQRRVVDPRPRYENIFEPISIFPEIEPDRVLFAPESSESYGIESFLRGHRGKLDWWLGYTYSRTEDVIGGRKVPRRIDQPHAVTASVNYRLNEWNVNLAWRYHTGWPTTAVSGRFAAAEDDEGDSEEGDEESGGEEGGEGDEEDEGPDILPVFGPFNAERVSPYHRLDLRASREWQKRRGQLGFFLELQNIYDRQNVAGFDIDFEFLVDEAGNIQLIPVEEPWGGLLPSFGITWEF